MKILVGMYTCHSFEYQGLHDLARETWGQDIHKLGDLKFFIGEGEPIAKPDIVQLNAPDGKEGLVYKVKAILEWMLRSDYDMILKIDGDTYINAPEIAKENYQGYDYIGAVVGQLGNNYAGTNISSFIQGSASWLSRKAAKIVIDNILPKMDELAPKARQFQGLISPFPHSEDLWCGQALADSILSGEIKALDDRRYGDGPYTYHFARDKQTISVYNWMNKLHQARPNLEEMAKVHETERG